MTAEDAVLHVASLRFETFVEVRVVQNAVLHCLTVIGEAPGRISEASAAELPDLLGER
jgi:uncharacterized protein with HEPN domain